MNKTTAHLFGFKIPTLIFYTEDDTLLAADFAHLFTCRHSVPISDFDAITDKLIRKYRKCLYLTSKEPCQLFLVEHTAIFTLVLKNGIYRIPIPNDYYNMIPNNYQKLDKPKLQQEIC